MLLVPAKDGFKEEDLGTSIYGDSKKISDEIFELLISKGEILKKVAPLVLEHKYLRNKTYVRLSDIYDASFKTRGEMRFLNTEVLINATEEGVKQGVFGAGIEEDGKVICKYLETEPEYLDENFLIVDKETCRAQYEAEKEEKKDLKEAEQPLTMREPSTLIYKPEELGKEELPEKRDDDNLSEVKLTLKVPKGNALEIGRLLNTLDFYFDEIEITIKAVNGKISRNDYENKIEETLRQLKIIEWN